MQKYKVASLKQGKTDEYGNCFYYDVYMHDPASDSDIDVFDLVEWMEVEEDPDSGTTHIHTGDAFGVEAENASQAIEIALQDELIEPKKGF